MTFLVKVSLPLKVSKDQSAAHWNNFFLFELLMQLLGTQYDTELRITLLVI